MIPRTTKPDTPGQQPEPACEHDDCYWAVVAYRREDELMTLRSVLERARGWIDEHYSNGPLLAEIDALLAEPELGWLYDLQTRLATPPVMFRQTAEDGSIKGGLVDD